MENENFEPQRFDPAPDPPTREMEPATVPAPPAVAEPLPEAPALTYAQQLEAMAREAAPGDILEDDPNKVFFVGVWGPEGGMLANYCCRLCKFATTGGTEVLMTHYKAKHIEKPPEAVQRPRSGLIGLNGLPL